MDNCPFCKIAKGEMEAKVEKETENLLVIHDIHPQAPLHLLLIPKEHVKDITELKDEVWVEMKQTVVGIARAKDLLGFRLVNNAGDSAAVSHMHLHFLGEVAADRAV